MNKKKYGSKRKLPVSRFSTKSRRRLGIDITRRLPFELQIQIQREAGRAIHRAMQSLVNAQIRRKPTLKRYIKPASVNKFYQ